MKKISGILFVIFLVVALLIIVLPRFGMYFYVQTLSPFVGFSSKYDKEYVPIPQKKAPSDHVSYKGEDGVDAQTLLVEREKAWVEYDMSGLIVGINQRKADPKKREYWAFYVNGELASVGPKDYITKDADVIEWKIDTY